MNNYLWIIMPGPRNYADKSTSYYSWLAHYYLQSSHKLCRWLFPNAQQALDLTQTKVVMGTVYSENSALSAFPVSQLKKKRGANFHIWFGSTENTAPKLNHVQTPTKIFCYVLTKMELLLLPFLPGSRFIFLFLFSYLYGRPKRGHLSNLKANHFLRRTARTWKK